MRFLYKYLKTNSCSLILNFLNSEIVFMHIFVAVSCYIVHKGKITKNTCLHKNMRKNIKYRNETDIQYSDDQ